MSDNTNVPLSTDETAALRQKLAETIKGLSADPELPEEVNRDICEIVRRCSRKNQGDKDLVDLAHLVAISATWPHFMHEAKQYLDAHRTEMDDLYLAYCICVHESLPDYNPEHDFITFMAPRVRAVFASTRARGSGYQFLRAVNT